MPSLSPGSVTEFGNSFPSQANATSQFDSSPPGSDGLFSIAYPSPRRRPANSALDVRCLVPISSTDIHAEKKDMRKVPDTGNSCGTNQDVVNAASRALKPPFKLLPFQAQTPARQERGKSTVSKLQLPATPSTIELEDHFDRYVSSVRRVRVSQTKTHPPNEGESSESKSNASASRPLSKSSFALNELAQMINRCSSSNRSVGIRSQDFLPGSDDDEVPLFFCKFPRALPELVVWPEIGIAMFANGQSLKHYQALDLSRMIKREGGEMVCGTNAFNNMGYLVAYPMGYGKTPLTIALILCNPPPKDFGRKNTSKATLIIVPNKGIMSHWRNEIEKFAPQLKICFFDSCRAILDLNADVILLTYDQLKFQRRCFLENPNSSHLGRIFQVTFYRVVGVIAATDVDEFHFARNPDTKLAATLLAIQKQHGLCLTGTPAQNSLRDFWIIFKFLGVTYENINNLEIFDRKVYSRRQKGPIVDPLAKKRLDTILADFAIFRNLIDPITGKELVPLPKRTDVTIKVTLSTEERIVYEFIKDLPKATFARIMRCRQACDHPTLLSSALEPTSDIAKDHDEDPDVIITKIETQVDRPVTGWPTELRHCLLTTYLSSKLAIMKGILEGLLNGSKAIVFTNFEKLFPAIAHVLEKMGIRWVEYSGNMTIMQRDKSLQQITSDSRCTVIIVSIMAGGTGLNITACDTVIVMEPWWNPYTEEQAIARAHRIGQTRPVRVHHLVTESSIEESIMKTQQVKRDTIGGLYGACSAPDDTAYAAWLAGP